MDVYLQMTKQNLCNDALRQTIFSPLVLFNANDAEHANI